MQLLLRFVVWALVGGVSAAVDLHTKMEPHPLVLHHYGHQTLLDLAPIGLFLFATVFYGSLLSAVGTGLMLGGLIGNGGELLSHGYATDWIVWGDRVTNVADIVIVFGLAIAWLDLIRRLLKPRPRNSGSSLRPFHAGALLAGSCGVVAGLVTGDLRIGEIVFLLVLIEAYVLDRILRRGSTYAG